MTCERTWRVLASRLPQPLRGMSDGRAFFREWFVGLVVFSSQRIQRDHIHRSERAACPRSFDLRIGISDFGFIVRANPKSQIRNPKSLCGGKPPFRTCECGYIDADNDQSDPRHPRNPRREILLPRILVSKTKEAADKGSLLSLEIVFRITSSAASSGHAFRGIRRSAGRSSFHAG